MIKSKIKSFRFEENLLNSTKETELKTKIPTILNLSLSRKGASYVLIHSIPISLSTPKERQYSIINALAPNNPFPLSNPMNNKIRIWLKTGKHSKGESIVGGENWLLLEKLLNPPSGSTISEDGEEREEGIIKDTGTTIEIGLNSYPLVEILLNEDELAKCCNGCGDFESCIEDSERFKRCNRCKQAYYCSTICQSKDWKSNHKSECYDEPNDDFKSLEESRRRNLLKLFGRTEEVSEEAGSSSTSRRSKMD